MTPNDEITSLLPRRLRDVENHGESEAAANGNPYPWNSQSWHIWNAGYQAAVSKMVSRMVGLSDRPRNGVPR